MNKIKGINIFPWIIGFIVLVAIYFAISFELFDDKPIEITRFDSNSDKYKLAIYYIPSNASQQDYIQIRKIYSNGIFNVIRSFERYQVVKKYQLLNNKLYIVLGDTSSYRQRQDTIIVNIPQ